MDEMIGYAVVFIIISGLVYALVKQIRETRSNEHIVGSPLFQKQLNRKNKIMTITLFGVLVFYTLNIVSSLNIVSTIPISNSFTALGTFVSFSVYLYAKFVLKPQQLNHRRSLYN